MSYELVFVVAILLFVSAWVVWMVAIGRGSRGPIIGGALAFVLLGLALVVINDLRIDDRRGEFREQIEAYIDVVADAKRAEFERSGAYSEELPDAPPELLTYDGGRLQEERQLEIALEAQRRTYTIEAELQDESYSLTVDRTGGGREEIRTCDADADGCVDGFWEPSPGPSS